jgi:hypothetical protein
MSAASDFVLVQLSIDAVGLARAGFGEMLIGSHNAPFPERIRRYKTLSAAVPGTFSADSFEGLALAAAFAQTGQSGRSVAVGRLGGTVTQRYDLAASTLTVGTVFAIDVVGKGLTSTRVSYTSLANLTFVDADVNTTTDAVAETAHGMLTGAGPFRLSNAGGALPTATPALAVDTNYWIIAVDADHYKFASSKANAIALTPVDITAAAGGGTHTLLRAANDVVMAQLKQGLDAVVGAGTAYVVSQVAGAGDTDTLRVTAASTSQQFSLAVTDPAILANAQTHAAPADVTLATDLAAIRVADQGWYTLITLYNSAAYVEAAEAWAESNGVTYAWDSCDTTIGTTALSGGTDVGSVSFGFGYARSMGSYYPAPASMLSVRSMGRFLPRDPGKSVPWGKTLSGITGLTLTDTFKDNLRAKRMNTYEQVLADRPFFWNGTVFSTIYRYFDITRNSDWYQDQAQKGVLEALLGVEIDPFTTAGIKLLQAALIGVGDLAFRQGVLADVPVTVAPKIEDILSQDKIDRNLSGLQQSGTFAGAIQSAIPVDVVLTF